MKEVITLRRVLKYLPELVYVKKRGERSGRGIAI
jgi:hypothetical protein